MHVLASSSLFHRMKHTRLEETIVEQSLDRTYSKRFAQSHAELMWSKSAQVLAREMSSDLGIRKRVKAGDRTSRPKLKNRNKRLSPLKSKFAVT